MAYLKRLALKYNGLSIQAKAALWFTLCNIIQKGISTITVPIFTRIMTTTQYGTYSVYLAWQSILLIFTSLNLYYGVFNNAMLKFEHDRDRYVASMQGLTFLSTTVVFGVYLVFRDACNEFLGMNTLLVCLMFIQLLSMPPLLFWSARQRFEYRYKMLVGVTFIKAIFNPLLGIIAVLLSEQKDVARIVTIVFVEAIIGLIICTIQYGRGRVFFRKEYWKYAFFFNFPLLPHYLSGTILNQADRIMIGKLVGTSEVALYSVAYNIGMLMLLFTDAVMNTFTPWMYEKMQKKEYAEIRQLGNILAVMIACLVVTLMFFAPELVLIFGSVKYADAVWVIPPVAGTTFFIFAYVLFVNIEFYFEENRMIMVASIAAALLNIALNALFIPIFGYLAAAYTTLLCYIIYTFSHYMFSTMVCKRHIEINNIFDIRYITFIAVLIIIAVCIFDIIYINRILRYVLFLVLVFVVVLKRKAVIETLGKMRKRG